MMQARVLLYIAAQVSLCLCKLCCFAAAVSLLGVPETSHSAYGSQRHMGVKRNHAMLWLLCFFLALSLACLKL